MSTATLSLSGGAPPTVTATADPPPDAGGGTTLGAFAVAVLVFLGVLAAGGAAFVYFTRTRDRGAHASAFTPICFEDGAAPPGQDDTIGGDYAAVQTGDG